MNTNRYIVGDFIIYTSSFKEPVAEICEVCEASYTIRFMQGNLAKVTSKEIKPIPLTPEILEKNGWKKSNYYGNDYTKGEFHFDGENFLHIGDYDHPLVDGPIEYVHELQHVFFGLNLYTGMSV